MDRRLDFLVIGAQKCATSWLYYCLRDHPMLHLPAKKREVEYLGGDLFQQRGADWYFSLLAGGRSHQKVGAVSVQYLFDPRSAGIVRTLCPDAKLIVSFRDPIERALSAYYWNVRTGRIPYLNPEDGLRRASGQGDFGADADVRTCDSDIIDRGRYDVQLKRYLAHFHPDQLLVVLYEDIRERPVAVLERIYGFIGVESGFRPPSLSSRPKHTTGHAVWIRMERALPSGPVFGKIMDLAGQLLFRLGWSGKKPSLSRPLTDRLLALYQPHVHETRRIIGELPPSGRPLTQDPLRVWNPGWSRSHV